MQQLRFVVKARDKWRAEREQGGADQPDEDVAEENRIAANVIHMLALHEGVGKSTIDQHLAEADQHHHQGDQPELVRTENPGEDDGDEKSRRLHGVALDRPPAKTGNGLSS